MGDVLSDAARVDAIMDRALKNSYHLNIGESLFWGIEAKRRMESAKINDESVDD